MSNTYEQPTKKEHKLPKKILVAKAREADVYLPPRTQLHIDPDDLAYPDDREHDVETCIHCQAELDPDYDVDEDGYCRTRTQPNAD